MPTTELPARGEAVSFPSMPRLVPASVFPRTWLLSPLPLLSDPSSLRRQVGVGVLVLLPSEPPLL